MQKFVLKGIFCSGFFMTENRALLYKFAFSGFMKFEKLNVNLQSYKIFISTIFKKLFAKSRF